MAPEVRLGFWRVFCACGKHFKCRGARVLELRSRPECLKERREKELEAQRQWQSLFSFDSLGVMKGERETQME